MSNTCNGAFWTDAYGSFSVSIHFVCYVLYTSSIHPLHVCFVFWYSLVNVTSTDITVLKQRPTGWNGAFLWLRYIWIDFVPFHARQQQTRNFVSGSARYLNPVSCDMVFRKEATQHISSRLSVKYRKLQLVPIPGLSFNIHPILKIYIAHIITCLLITKLGRGLAINWLLM